MAFGDVFAGFQQASKEHYTNLLQMDYENKHGIAEQYSKIAQDPRYDEETQREAQRRALHVLTFEPGKKLPKEYENFMFQRQAPPPTPIPGGPGAQNMPIAQQLSGPGSPTPPGIASVQGGEVPSLPNAQDQGGPAPVAPPNTGPSGQIAGGQISHPTPPPQMMGPMPFEQQVARTGAEAVAKSAGQFGIAGMKAAIPQKQGVDTIQGDDGRRYHTYIYQRRNPDNGVMERFNIQEDQPLGFFAPRSGATNTVANLKKWQAEGNRVLSPDGKPLDLNQMQDTDILQHIGEDRYTPVSERKELRNVGGYEVPYGPTSGTVGAPVGLSQGALPNLRETLVPGPGGTQKKVVLSSEKELQQPQQTAPQPPQAPPPQAPPGGILNQGPFFQGAPGQPKVITPELISQLMANPENKANNVTEQDIREGLKSVGFQDPQAPTRAPLAPPQAPNLQRGSVTDVQGAGHRLSAEQIKDTATRAGVLGTTLGRGANVLNTFDQIMGSSDKLSNFLKRAQLQIVANPASPTKFSLLVQNAIGLTKPEAQFAADYASLGEDINVMRAITNATGFRGKEAFEVLQGQRGALLGNPDVFKRTLQNSLRTIITQLGPLKRQLEASDYPVADTKDIINGYRAVFKDPKELETVLRNDGWIR